MHFRFHIIREAKQTLNNSIRRGEMKDLMVLLFLSDVMKVNPELVLTVIIRWSGVFDFNTCICQELKMFIKYEIIHQNTHIWF